MGFFGNIGEGLGLKKSTSQKKAEEASELFNNINAPEFGNIDLQRQQSVGDPRDFVTSQQQSEFNNIQTDPAARQAQIDALNRLNDISESGGITDEDRARLDQIGREEAIREKGQREALLRNAAARGTAGSGLNLAQQLQNQQSSADRASVRGTQVNADAARRAFDATQSAGQLGGQLRSQDFGEQAAQAQAQDAINRFNSGQLTSAGLAGFQNQQNIANANTGLANEQTILNRVTLPQQTFQNNTGLAQSRADALNRVGAAADARNNRLAGTVGAAIGAAKEFAGRKGGS